MKYADIVFCAPHLNTQCSADVREANFKVIDFRQVVHSSALRALER